jgi:hypothetical protein
MHRWANAVGRAALATLILVAAAPAAHGDWLESSSDHFVIYSDQDEKSVKGFSERLELFHAAMAFWFQRQQAKPSPSNRVSIFVVSSERQVREFAKTDNRYLAGIYLPRAGQSIALVPEVRRQGSKFDLSSETILYHEYAHHFMATLTSRTFPRWLVEGFAEFFASAHFHSDEVGLGRPATHRARELAFARTIPIRKLVDFDGGTSNGKQGFDAFYGQAWTLFHYLQFEPERAGQLAKYQDLLATGDTAVEAAEGAFGDLDQLESDLEAYLKRRRISYVGIPRRVLPIGPIQVRPLRAGEAAMMPTRIRSTVGVTREEALSLVPEARRLAALHPQDPVVLASLAEAEHDAGFDDAAMAAADRALALDPGQMNAHIQKGYALARKVQSGALPADKWKDVRGQWVKANRVENDHPIPLAGFYESFLDQGIPPTRTAIEGLEWAMALAPFDSSLRWMAAQQMIKDERLEDAAQTLAPLAYSPHPGEHTDTARKLLGEVEERLSARQAQVSDAE